jgi:hypothetical protein
MLSIFFVHQLYKYHTLYESPSAMLQHKANTHVKYFLEKNLKTKNKFFENTWVGSKIELVTIPKEKFLRTFSGEFALRTMVDRAGYFSTAVMYVLKL